VEAHAGGEAENDGKIRSGLRRKASLQGGQFHKTVWKSGGVCGKL